MVIFEEIELEVAVEQILRPRIILTKYRTSMIPQKNDNFIFNNVIYTVLGTVWDIGNKKATLIVSG